MEWLKVVVLVLSVLLVAVVVKLILLKKAIKDLNKLIVKRVENNENQPLYINSSDKDLKKLAVTLNSELVELQNERLKYQSGDRALMTGITNITHDLRTPLTAMKGYLELIESEEKFEKLEEYLTIIKTRCNKMEELTAELFKFTLLESVSEEICFENINVNSVLEESIAELYGAFIEKNITPKVNITDTKIQKILGKKQLSTVFTNIISNGVKYSDGDFFVELNPDGEITFTNTAKDLDEVSVGKLFDRFFTVNSAHNSSGLGLSIAKTLILQMNGTIDATYHKDKLIITIMF